MRPIVRNTLLGLLVIAVNVALFLHYPDEKAMKVFSTEGLFLDGLGAFLILLPDLKFFDKISGRNDKATRLKSGYNRLLVEEDGLWQGDEGFEEILDVIEEMADVDTSPVVIWPRLPGGVGSGGNVHLIPESKVQDDGEVSPGPGDAEKVGSQRVVENWVQQEIDRVTQVYRFRMLRVGAVLLTIGFGLQFVSSFASI